MSNPRVLFFQSWESGNTPEEPMLPVMGAHALRSVLRFDGIRKWFPGDVINPSEGVLDLTRNTTELKTIKRAGLLCFGTFLYAPAHATGGVPWARSYTRGPWEWFKDTDGQMKTRPRADWWMKDPPPMSADWSRWYGEEMGYHFGDAVDYVGLWNEVGLGDTYYVPLGASDNHQRTIREFHERFTIPFVEGYRKSYPNARFVGPAAVEWGTLHHHLEHEMFYDQHLYDIIDYHPYAWAGPEGSSPRGTVQRSLERIEKEFHVKAELFGRGRPEWFSEVFFDGTETQSAGEQIIEWTREVLKRYPWLGAINYHLKPNPPEPIWFEPGTFYSRSPKLSDTGRAMQQIIRETNTKKRAVRA